MYVIVNIAGKQFRAEKGKFLYVPKLDAKENEKISFDNVLLVDNDGKIKIGDPTVKGAKVTGELLENKKDDKVIVFKKKRRKGYKVMRGHRQEFSKVLINDITV